MKFKLIFDGEALSNNEIYPKDLSTALLAIDDLLKEANFILNKGKISLEVKVKGSFETGCFKINLVLSFIDRIKDLLTCTNIESILNAKAIIELICGSAGCLIALIKFLKGGKVEKIFENEDGTLTVSKQSSNLKIERKVYDLYKSYKIRKSFENLVKPLIEQEGISDVAFQYENSDESFCMITKEEAVYFKCPEPEEEKIDKEAIFETNINIVNLSFKEGNKWFVNDGQSSFYATVEDNTFLQAINNNEISFTKGDILRVRLRREQFYNKTENKLKTENFIEKVIRHSKPPTMLPLFNS